MRLKKRMMKQANDFNNVLFKEKIKEKYEIYKKYRHLIESSDAHIGGGSNNGFYTIDVGSNELTYRGIVEIKQHLLDKLNSFDSFDFSKLESLNPNENMVKIVVNNNGEELEVMERNINYQELLSVLSTMILVIMDAYHANSIGEEIRKRKQ